MELGRPRWPLENQSTGGRLTWSSMKQSWGLKLFILGAVVHIEGESPRFGWGGYSDGLGAVLCRSSP